MQTPFLYPLKLIPTSLNQIKLQESTLSIESDLPDYWAELTNSLILDKGAGDPSFTRTTTATVTDFEGIIRNVKSGEARFRGARRVENLIQYSEDFTQAYYSKTAAGTGVAPVVTGNYGLDPNGNMTADRIQFNLGVTPAGSDSRIYKVITPAPGSNYINSIWLKTTDGSTKSLYMVGGPTGNVIISVTGTWTRFVQSPTITGAYAQIQLGLNITYGTSTTADILAWGAQLEDVTSQSVKIDGGYISSGVLSFPYHGAGVDGVKYFKTKLDGTLIPDSTLQGFFPEGVRTNLITYSEQFDNASWIKDGVLVTANQVTSPDGLTTADKIEVNASGGSKSISKTVTVTAAIHSLSFYVKAGNATQISFGLYQSGFVAQTGLILSGPGSISGTTVQTVTGLSTTSWTRVSVASNSALAAGSVSLYIYPNTSGEVIGDYVYLWGAQLEAANFSSSYIPTTTASVTRNSDILTYPFGLPGTGTAYAEAWSETNKPLYGRIIGRSDGRTPLTINNNSIIQSYDGTEISLNNGISFNAGIKKVASKWNNVTLKRKIANDGAVSPESTYNGSFSGNTYTVFGCYSLGGVSNSLFGTMKNVKIWKKYLSDSKFSRLTL